MRPALLKAYRSTRYQVAEAVVRIGRRCPEIDGLLMAQRAREAAFITAYNPRSRRMPEGWNQRMQGRLLQMLGRGRVLPAQGSWRCWSEAHLVVFGDTRLAGRWARRFRQHAIVIVRLRQPARLKLLY
jgi:hypothetical protein